MKKIIILILLTFLFSGCYDYVEINDMAIIYGVAIDLNDNEYNVTFEILNTKNKDDNSNQDKVYYATGKGFSISEAITNTSLSVSKTPYLAHLKTVIISEKVAENKLEDIIDFLLRDNHIRNIFYLVLAKDYKASDILTNISTNNPIMSDAISNLIENKNLRNNISSDMNFEKFMKVMTDKNEDVYLTSVTLDEDLVKLTPLGIFKDYKIVGYISEEEAGVFNLLNKNSEYHFKTKCPNEDNFISYMANKKPNVKMDINNNLIDINLELELRLVENHCNIDLRDYKLYDTLQNDASNTIKTSIEQLINTLKNKDSDILKFRKLYYQKYKKEINFQELNTNVSVKSIINRNGLIFEVKR